MKHRWKLSLLVIFIAFTASATELVGYAVLPADTFAEGPPTGQFDDTGNKLDAPRFPSPPVQGFSSVQWKHRPDSFWVLSDNGFGRKANSADYLLRIYELTIHPKTSPTTVADISVVSHFGLHDPEGRSPFEIVNHASEERPLTGADFDTESFVVAPDGTFWIGDEFGPFVLHIDAAGKLLDAPYPVPNVTAKDALTRFVCAPESPLAARMNLPANIGSSGGFEGMAITPDGTRLRLLLEKPVEGDPKDRLRIYTIDIVKRRFEPRVFLYPLENEKHAIGDMTAINENEYLVVERDNLAGEKAAFKRIAKIDLSKSPDKSLVHKEYLADLLNIADPNNLAGFGPQFRFPFWTIECVLVIDKDTILVMNDNNYDGKGGRGPDVTDPNEMIWLKLDTPLNYTR